MRETRAAESSLAAVKDDASIYSINHGNSFSKLLRIVAYIRRLKEKQPVANATISLEELER